MDQHSIEVIVKPHQSPTEVNNQLVSWGALKYNTVWNRTLVTLDLILDKKKWETINVYKNSKLLKIVSNWKKRCGQLFS